MTESKKLLESKPPQARGEVWLNNPLFQQGIESSHVGAACQES